MNYKADMYMMIPYYINSTKTFEQSISKKSFSDDAEACEYIKMIDTVFDYECIKEVTANCRRSFLGSFRLSCASDSTIHNREKYECSVNIYVTYSYLTKLAIVTLVCSEIDVSLTFMLEELNRNNGLICVGDAFIPVDDYMDKQFSLMRCGRMKHTCVLSQFPEPAVEMKYIMMAEEYGTQDIDSLLKESSSLSFEDISLYEVSELYASDAGVCAVYENEWGQYKDRLYNVTILLMIVELIMFKTSAVTRTNRTAVELLESNKNPSLKSIEELNSSFGQTIRFWDTDNFIYLSTRIIAYKISKAFMTDESMEKYNRNQSFLEHLMEIRSVEASERENKVLSFLAIVLTLIQMVPMMYSIIEYIVLKTITLSQLLTALGACGLTAATTLLLIVLLKKIR